VEERLPASLAGLVVSARNGAHVVRVHDVKASCDALAVASALEAERERTEWSPG
jgi:dihydropteroate synthase